MSIVIDGVPVEFVDSMKCLGVMIDYKLHFDHHINWLCSKINFTLRRLYSLNLYLPMYVKHRIAHALLMSNMLYCAEVFTGSTAGEIRKYKLLLHKIVRFVYSVRIRTPISNYVVNFLGCDFNRFLHIRILLHFYKIMKSNCPEYLRCQFLFSHSVRNPQILYPRISTSLHELSFHVRVARIWNSLPRELKSFVFSVDVFRSKLLEYALSNNL